jgi:hypothetical protein
MLGRMKDFPLTAGAGGAPRIALLAAACVACALGAPAQKQSPAAPAEASFGPGEKLRYQVAWEETLKAATLDLEAIARGEHFGRPAWHLQARVATVHPLRLIYPMDDQFDSYAAAPSLVTLQFEQYLREPRRREDRIARLVGEQEPAGDGPAVRVPPETRDPLAALYFLRGVDWDKKKEMKLNVYDGRKLYEVRAAPVAAEESVRTPLGRFAARKITLRVFERGRERRDLGIAMWLARERGARPVFIEAELPFGRVRAELAASTQP